MSTTHVWTESELMALPEDGCKRELVDGEIRVMNPAGYPHGLVIVQLTLQLAAHVKACRLGYVADSSTGCWMPSGNLRCPDLTFVARERLPDGPQPGFLRVVPDLAVEVVSPGDTQREILDKVGEYLEAGVRLAWVIDPGTRTAVVHRSLTDVRVVQAGGWLEGEDVVPGFRCRLAELFS